MFRIPLDRLIGLQHLALDVVAVRVDGLDTGAELAVEAAQDVEAAVDDDDLGGAGVGLL